MKTNQVVSWAVDRAVQEAVDQAAYLTTHREPPHPSRATLLAAVAGAL